MAWDGMAWHGMALNVIGGHEKSGMGWLRIHWEGWDGGGQMRTWVVGAHLPRLLHHHEWHLNSRHALNRDVADDVI